jgi:hypothetical protein
MDNNLTLAVENRFYLNLSWSHQSEFQVVSAIARVNGAHQRLLVIYLRGLNPVVCIMSRRKGTTCA